MLALRTARSTSSLPAVPAPAPNVPRVVVGVGEVLWDLLPAGKQLGGAPANFAYHAAALGARGVVVSRVGDDALGREVLERLQHLGLDTAHVTTDPRHPTGAVEVRLDAQGVAEYVIHERVAWDYIPVTPSLLDLAARADAVCYGTLAQRSTESRQTIRHFLAATRPDRCLKVFDINLRQQYYNAALVRDLLPLSHILKLNDEEVPVVARLLRVAGAGTDVLRQLLRDHPNLRLVALTRGGRGSVLVTKHGEEHDHGGFSADVVDTVGAGDAFTAALVTGLLQPNRPRLAEINAFANRVAAFVCSQPGATPRMPPGLSRVC
jgi:fructokinase